MQQIIEELTEKVSSEVTYFLSEYTQGDNTLEFYFPKMEDKLEHEVEQILESVSYPDEVDSIEYQDGNIVITICNIALEEITERLMREWGRDHDDMMREFYESRGI